MVNPSKVPTSSSPMQKNTISCAFNWEIRMQEVSLGDFLGKRSLWTFHSFQLCAWDPFTTVTRETERERVSDFRATGLYVMLLACHWVDAACSNSEEASGSKSKSPHSHTWRIRCRQNHAFLSGQYFLMNHPLERCWCVTRQIYQHVSISVLFQCFSVISISRNLSQGPWTGANDAFKFRTSLIATKQVWTLRCINGAGSGRIWKRLL